MRIKTNLILMFFLLLFIGKSMAQQLTLQTGEQNGIKWLRYSPDGKLIATFNTYGVNIRNSTSGKIIYNLNHFAEHAYGIRVGRL